jgi:putative flippase GtrA
MHEKLKPFFSTRFLKFLAVGASGVFVNLGALALLADALGIQVNLASALAIEISINSNFVINEVWTFRDCREPGRGLFKRLLQFHIVSIIGAMVQWTVFIVGNMCWLLILEGAGGFEHYAGQGGSGLPSLIAQSVISPPDVGNLKYLSQLFGIGLATLWNFVANFYWTWRQKKPEATNE